MDVASFLDEFGRRDWQRAEEGTVRFALIGLGWWTRERALPAIESSDFCEATVAVSGSTDKAEELVAEWGTLEHAITYDEYHDGAAEDAYDAVYVSTPNALHLPYAETAADLGKGVLCEKPMEASTGRAERMVEACADGGVRLMVAYRMQTEPAVRRARELVREGFVGEPAFVESHMTQRLLDIFPDPDQWRLDTDLAGPGGSVTDLGIYAINTSRFVLDADPAGVVAMTHTGDEDFAGIPDERAGFTVELDGGVYAACTAGQNAVESGRFAVIGTEGEIALEPAFFADDRRSLVVARNGTSARLSFEPADQMREEFDYFADRVLTGAEITPDGEHGLIDMRTIEAVYEAAESESRVDI